jgi:hypothetical protein
MSQQMSRDDVTYAKELVELSLKGLPLMWNEQSGLFCYRRTRARDGTLVCDDVSNRYTLITLLGLHRAREIGKAVPFEINTIAMPFVSDVRRLDNLGDVGLLIWLCALAFPEYLEKVFSQISIDTICEMYPEGKKRKTMELSFLLTGLSYAAQTSSRIKDTVRKPASALYEIIRNNYRGRGIFSHGHGRNPVESLRCRMGSFADQVYPAYAFAAYSSAFDIAEACEIALACARKLCQLQGDQGQWWWHYDSKKGAVLGRYPVFSVHQEGMAPMMLSKVGKLANTDFSENIFRGLRWNTGKNEIRMNMVDTQNSIIWRCLYRPAILERVEELLGLAGFRCNAHKKPALKVLHEGRPYCLGWLLYAFAGMPGIS